MVERPVFEAGKTYVDSNNEQVFLVGLTHDGFLLGQHLGTKTFQQFYLNGDAKIPNYGLVKEYKEPIKRSPIIYLYQNTHNLQPFVTLEFSDEPIHKLLATKRVTITEGEFVKENQ